MDLVSGGKNASAALGWFEAPKRPRKLDAWEWHEIMPVGWLMSLQVVPTLLGTPNFQPDHHESALVMSDRRGENRGVY